MLWVALFTYRPKFWKLQLMLAFYVCTMAFNITCWLKIVHLLYLEPLCTLNLLFLGYPVTGGLGVVLFIHIDSSTMSTLVVCIYIYLSPFMFSSCICLESSVEKDGYREEAERWGGLVVFRAWNTSFSVDRSANMGSSSSRYSCCLHLFFGMLHWFWNLYNAFCLFVFQVLEVQLPGKRAVNAAAFWNGLRGQMLKKLWSLSQSTTPNVRLKYSGSP